MSRKIDAEIRILWNKNTQLISVRENFYFSGQTKQKLLVFDFKNISSIKNTWPYLGIGT